MRNLKRALSLTLASVMLLGMMVMGSSALSFKDSDGIVNIEAADVMNAAGIMVGDNYGDFLPDEIVTRAQMAIIVIRMIYGADMNVKQFEGETKFSDVPANVYYSGYINLATQLGIINGYGDGRFGPDDTVTTAQASLMLCRALGYFQEASEIGDNWVLSSITKGTEIGLFGDLKLDRNAGLRRDDVAEMTYNAITGTTPVAKNEIFGYYTVGASLTAGVIDVDTYQNDTGTLIGYRYTLAWKIHDLVTSPESNHGEQGHVWVDTKNNAVLTDFYSTDDILGVSTDGTVISKLTNRTDSKFKAELDTTTVSGYSGPAFYFNGTEITGTTTSSTTTTPDGRYFYVSNNTLYESNAATGGTGTEYAKKGAVVTFRDVKEGGSYDGKAEVVTIVEKTVTKLSRDAVTEVSGSATTLKYAIGVVDTDVPIEQVHGYEGLVKDDVILSVALAGGHDSLTHYYIEKAASVEGEVASIRATTVDGVTRDRYTLTSGSTAYEESGLVNSGKGIVTSDAKLGAEVAFYLDNGGYVIYTKLLDAADDNYAVVLDYDARTMEGQKTKLLLTDGTTVTVTADFKVGDNTVTMQEADPSTDTTKIQIAKAGASSLVEYSIEGGVYKLKAVTPATATEMGSVTVTGVTRNKATVGTGLYANERTAFILRDNTAAKALSTYTGIGNVPDVTAGTFLAVGKGASVSYIFVLDATSSISSTDIFYVTEHKHDLSNTYKSDGSVDKNLATYNVVMNGEVKKLTGLKGTMEAAITGTGAYRVSSYDSEGYVNGLARIPDSTPDTYYEGNLDYDTAAWAKDFDGLTLTYQGDGAVVDKDTTWIRVNKDGVASMGSESDLLASTTAGEKYTPVIVVYRVDNGARTGLADVVFVFNGSSSEPNGQQIVVAAEVPAITAQPAASTTVTQGSISGTLSVTVTALSDGGTLKYQWKQNGDNVGTDSSSLTIPTDLTAGTYTFTCVVTNENNTLSTPGSASVTSSNAVVTVKPATPQARGSNTGVVSTKTVTIADTNDLPEGTYKLYADDGTTCLATQTAGGSGDKDVAFVVPDSAGLTANTEFKCKMTVTINGVESDAVSITVAAGSVTA